MSEKYIGTYIEKHPEVRKKVVLATKVVGFQRSSRVPLFRTDPSTPGEDRLPTTRLDRESIITACDASLRRLQTNYIDLYQIHWPDRYIPCFGSRGYDTKHERENTVPIRETLEAINELLCRGKIKAYGLSNESCFGVCEYVRIADEMGMQRPVTIQNPFCLLDRQFEIELAEACSPSNFNISLLPWSVLAGGLLTGEYHTNEFDKNRCTESNSDELKEARFVKFPKFQQRFTTDATMQATEEYLKISNKHDMLLATMALAFCKSRWYIGSTIVGARNLVELQEDIDAFKSDLTEDVLSEIDIVHNMNKDPIVRVQHVDNVP